MNSIRQTAKLNQRELDEVVRPEASWHRDYSDTAFIFVGGIPSELSEGDVITIFSQYGEPVFINLVRDKETGKSKGFCFLKYEDQRSCDLAVDNLGGATVLGRMLNVDHTRYKKRDDEEIYDNTYGLKDNGVHKAVAEVLDTESEEESRPMLKEEIELAELMRNEDDDDPMKAYMIKQKKEEVEVARMALVKRESKSKSNDGKHKKHKSRRSRRHEDEDEGSERREKKRHRRRERSITPVVRDGSVEKLKHRRGERSETPVLRKDLADRPKRRNKSRTRSRSRTPINSSSNDADSGRRRYDRSISMNRKR